MMFYIAWVLTLLIAALHVWFAWLEIVEWGNPRTRSIFGITEEFALESSKLASNIGLYNAFLALGLVLGLLFGATPHPQALVIFLLFWVLVAGLWGAATVSLRIAFVQALPALLALLAWWDA
jgi:putative membrane protein